MFLALNDDGVLSLVMAESRRSYDAEGVAREMAAAGLRSEHAEKLGLVVWASCAGAGHRVELGPLQAPIGKADMRIVAQADHAFDILADRHPR